ncbi:MAG: hypothetical protein K2K72_08475, partial [Duncaniella sp.]|nr:hypothetical protein [Duncaniella sp.]
MHLLTMKHPASFTRSLLLALLAVIFAVAPTMASESHEASGEKESEGIDAKEIIFEHLGDAYGWEVPFNHHVRIPLPVIVWSSKGLHVFSSARVTGGDTYTHPDGSTFRIAGEESDHKGKVVEVMEDGSEVRPNDFSITKNVMSAFISV